MVDPATGTAAVEYDCDSFGNRLATGLLTQRYGFTGREHDDESGVIFFRARHYDPATGMFLQRDPIGFAGGDMNLYAYVWNNPTKWTDPSGLSVDGSMTMGRSAAMARGLGGLFGAIRNLASAISATILLSVSGDTPNDNDDPVPPPPPPEPDPDDKDPKDKIKCHIPEDGRVVS